MTRLLCPLLAAAALALGLVALWQHRELSATRAALVELRASLDGSDRIVRAIDGDTLELADTGRVRLLGVNTPELWEKTGKGWKRLDHPDPRALAAYEYLRSLEGRAVRVQFDRERRDRYGRNLAHLYLLPDGPDLAGDLLRRGWGELCAIKPNTTRYAAWKADQALAQVESQR